MKEFSTYKRYDISDYYEYFNNTNKNRFISLSGKKTRPGIVSFELYKKIIYQYLRIYFYELVLGKEKKLYFFLGGWLYLNKCGNWIRTDKSNLKVIQENKLKETQISLGVHWWEIPWQNKKRLRLKKIVGQIIGNRIREWHYLTEELKKRFDLSLLPSANDLIIKKTKK